MPESIPDEHIAQLADLIYQGRKIEAIKAYKELTGAGLKESKDRVEELERTLRQQSPEKFTASASRPGCFGSAALWCVCAGAGLWWLAR